eukprot:TRINITY_DN189_c0_g1_i11.p1 TRINITY_DN189_c0_g1~~TRINITY_DN189_c0_g1_i11.p1  ORF type:complete len:416 (-),score=66.18 TRINITY_DN189_c0_g1_i11:263-1510(-)
MLRSLVGSEMCIRDSSAMDIDNVKVVRRAMAVDHIAVDSTTIPMDNIGCQEKQTLITGEMKFTDDKHHPPSWHVTRSQLLRYGLGAVGLVVVVTFLLLGSPLTQFFGSEQGYYPQWAGMRAHLSDTTDPHVLRIRQHLYFYDLPMGYVVSWEGLFYVLYWNLWSRYCVGPLCPSSTVFTDTTTNHGLSMWYFKPYIRGDPRYRNPTKWNFDVLQSEPFPKSMVEDSVQILKAHAADIKDEFFQRLAQNMTSHPDQRTEVDKGGSWDWNFLYGTTGKNSEVCDRIPKTHAVVLQLPVTFNYGFVFFSRLKPGTHIKPHTGSTNLRIRLHLGILIPVEKDYTATIRAGTQHQAWVEDDVLVFDDAFEHEVVYEGKTERVVFIMDLWHPHVTERERELLSYRGFGPFGTKGPSRRVLD